ncbi:MAG: TetR/AcrR family transcriptional regulator [Acidobacteria bacterium]|nr:MAG: TetR/AcrR family transcriptional regulator [Acidobacteriota bacterium]GIK77661.1 MAG: TetR family transcriptional regulator [Actinomycetes bacterium]
MVEAPERERAVAPRRGRETRAAIDAAAVELFAQRGYHATSMRALAAAAEIQPAAIYHWYPGKEAILVHLQDEFMAELTERVVAAMAEQDRPALKLAAAVREHVAYHGEHPDEAFVTDSEIRALRERPRRALIAKRDEYQRMFGGLVRAGIADGSLRTSDPDVATYAILLQCTGVALWFDPSGPLGLDEVAAVHVELVLGGLGADRKLIAAAVAAPGGRG